MALIRVNIEDRRRSLALRRVQFLQGENVGNGKEHHQNGQQEIKSPRHGIIAPWIRFAALGIPRSEDGQRRLERDAGADRSHEPPTGAASREVP